MQIQIVSKGIDISPVLSERISSQIEDMMDKYIHRDGEAHASVFKDGTGFGAVLDVHLPSGVSMQGSGKSHDAYGAADEALEHLEKRLRRYNRRLKDHHAGAKAEALAMYILETPPEEDDEEVVASDEPLVIAETKAEIRTMTVSMAALELGLSGAGAVVFHNTRHGGLNVVFKRSDGNIGWIDPGAS